MQQCRRAEERCAHRKPEAASKVIAYILPHATAACTACPAYPAAVLSILPHVQAPHLLPRWLTAEAAAAPAACALQSGAGRAALPSHGG